MEIRTSLEGITAEHLAGGFFEGWPNPPSPEAHLRILHGSYAAAIAMDGDQVVGFINAISDGVSSAFIPLLEVLPEYRGQRLGEELVRALLAQLEHLYSIDLACDAGLIPYYEKLGFVSGTAMLRRNYSRQSGD